eukprot:527342-Pyramimonas_sp.AAC.1
MDVMVRACIGVQIYRHVSVRGGASQDFVLQMTDECSTCLSSPFSMPYRVAVPIKHVVVSPVCMYMHTV